MMREFYGMCSINGSWGLVSVGAAGGFRKCGVSGYGCL